MVATTTDLDRREPDALREDAAHLALAIAEAQALLARLDATAGDHLSITLHHQGGGHDRMLLRRGALREQITTRIDHLRAAQRLLIGDARALERIGSIGLRREFGLLARGLGQD